MIRYAKKSEYFSLHLSKKTHEQHIEQEKEREQSRNTKVQDVSPKVLVIGVDGLSYNVLYPLIKQKKLPHFENLLRLGTFGILLSEEPIRSPALWTTIVTGKSREEHQIFDFVDNSYFWPDELRNHSDIPNLVTSAQRKSQALWNILTDNNLRTSVVGWLNTWPAENINGDMIAPYIAYGEEKQSTIKGAVYKDELHQTHPEQLFEEIKPYIISTEDVTSREFAAILSEPLNDSVLYDEFPFLNRYLFTARWSLAHTFTVFQIGSYLLQNRNSDLTMLYFEAADSLGHRFWTMRNEVSSIQWILSQYGTDTSFAEELKEYFGNVIDNYYILLDSLIGELVRLAGKNTTVMIISDHGFTDQKPEWFDENVPFTGAHKKEGVFIAQGPSVKEGKYLSQNMTLYDITPMILYILNLPVAKDMTGKIHEEVFETEFLSSHTITFVESYKRSAAQDKLIKKQFQPSQRNLEIQRLQTLGYVQ